MRINSLPSLREIRSQLVLTADAPNRMAVSRASRDETLIRITRGGLSAFLPSRGISVVVPANDRSRISHLCPGCPPKQLCPDGRVRGLGSGAAGVRRQGADRCLRSPALGHSFLEL